MKKILISLMLCIISINTFAQSYNFIANYHCAGPRNTEGYIQWSNWSPCNVKITITDTAYGLSIITIFDHRTQVYTCSNGYGDIDSVSGMTCSNSIDEEGINCELKLIKGPKGVEFYIFWKNCAIAYNIPY